MLLGITVIVILEMFLRIICYW